MDTDYYKGVFLTLLASILWALGYFMRKLVIEDISPVLMTFFTSLAASIAVFIVFRLKYSHVKTVFMQSPKSYLSLSIIGVIIGTTLMFTALLRIDLGVTTLIEKTQPLFVILFAFFFLHERIKRKAIPYVFLALFGSYMVSQPVPFSFSPENVDFIGIICAFGAAICWASVTIVGKTLVVKAKPEEIVFIRFGLAALLMSPFFFLKESMGLVFNPSVYLMSIVIGAAVFATALSYSFYYEGLKFIDASVSALIELATPVVAVLLGILFLNEMMTPTQFLGGFILLFSIYMIVLLQGKYKTKKI